MTEMNKNMSEIFKSADLDLETPNHHLVFRTNNTNDYVVEQSSGLQVDNFSKVSGKEVFRDSQYMVTVGPLHSMACSDCLSFYQTFTMLLIFFPQIQSRIGCQYLHCSCKWWNKLLWFGCLMQILSLWPCKGVPSDGFSRPFGGTSFTAICQWTPE